MAARWTAWLVWAALAGSLVFWALRLGAQAQPLPPGVQTVGVDQAVRGDMLRLFAAPAAVAAPTAQASPAAGRLHLLGVVAEGREGQDGWAVLSLDGKPARTLRVGAAVDGDWIVQRVAVRRVEIGPKDGPPAAVLELAPPPLAATGRPAGMEAPVGEAPAAAPVVDVAAPPPPPPPQEPPVTVLR